MAIYSCMGCVAPKRHPGCHGHCPEYLAQKANHDKLKDEMEKAKNIERGLYAHYARVAYRVNKARHKKG